MSEQYIKNHFEDIKKYANVVEQRLDDKDYTMENVFRDNAKMLEQCQKHKVNYILIENEYKVDIEL